MYALRKGCSKKGVFCYENKEEKNSIKSAKASKCDFETFGACALLTSSFCDIRCDLFLRGRKTQTKPQLSWGENKKCRLVMAGDKTTWTNRPHLCRVLFVQVCCLWCLNLCRIIFTHAWKWDTHAHWLDHRCKPCKTLNCCRAVVWKFVTSPLIGYVAWRGITWSVAAIDHVSARACVARATYPKRDAMLFCTITKKATKISV